MSEGVAVKPILGYKASHELHQPDKLLEFAVEADRCGFDTLWASDHFHPWAHTGGAAGFAWVWIASAAERTRNMRIGTSVTAPILRYHPGLVAQAFATLDIMYPDRIFLGLGSGEALNESPLGYVWPSPRQRLEMLEEAIVVIRKLWTEDFVSYKGKYYTLKKANLYSKPKKPLRIFVAAAGPKAARLAGRLADGLVVSGSVERGKTLLDVFEDEVSRSGRNFEEMEKVAEVNVSYDKDYKAALKACRFWAGCMIPAIFKYDISDPREIEANGRCVGDEVFEREWIVATTADEHIRRIEEYVKAGFNHLHFASSSPDEPKFIRFYGEEVLPHFH
jgi:coenzyme F420-dependent glucose-6-phosphate dehydrogenase